MTKEDIYTTEFDFINDFKFFQKVQLKQVVYRDDRMYQSIILEWKHYAYGDVREMISAIKLDKGLMDMLSTAQPFASYGFTSNKLAITFKKDLKLSKDRAEALIRYIIKIIKK
ncbi:hypothetical protein CEY12_06120 [Chryseobacterium sp. T16E-39]|uniref:hypothetical protein n=1 Tax=Chryseobacterium sp. T16E-39 TaxID=2015076 RepID=UPI000B5B1049|nr:hypothetical protein [Chryseobacterium sp. T16E-39]ASK29704.1 hypothetical protein CEY12_06120 [Chryseobacterium sp. T16E-39]